MPAQSGVGSRERVRPVSTIMAHSGEIEALASSGNILASASQDHFLKVKCFIFSLVCLNTCVAIAGTPRLKAWDVMCAVKEVGV